MEEVYPREEPHAPAAVARETGAGGRVVYFPWNLGGVFWEVLAADHQRLIENAVRWALGRSSRVEVEGRSVLDVALREDGEGLAVLLFNLTNPMMMKGPTRETWPVGRHEVSVALPEGRTGARARLLVADADAAVGVSGGRAVVEVPGIELIEVVHLTWD
jgi:hypothetical protein